MYCTNPSPWSKLDGSTVPVLSSNQPVFFFSAFMYKSIDRYIPCRRGRRKKKKNITKRKKKKTIYVARSNPFYPILGILGFFFF